ncbi:Major sperm protein [Aphelenchoides besseyi]|nr:Major sperm protein [Aphelenchoides besseyi]
MQQQQAEDQKAVVESHPLKMVSVEPFQLKFNLAAPLPIKTTFKVVNIAKHRVAWRFRCTAPTRYIVSPQSGFLTASESLNVTVQLAGPFHQRHKFLVQAIAAPEDEQDRRKVWQSDRANSLEHVQCIRMFPIGTTPFITRTESETSGHSSDSSYDSSTTTTTGSALSTSSASDGQSTAKKSAVEKQFDKKNVATEIVRLKNELDRLVEQCKSLGGQVAALEDRLKGMERNGDCQKKNTEAE